MYRPRTACLVLDASSRPSAIGSCGMRHVLDGILLILDLRASAALLSPGRSHVHSGKPVSHLTQTRTPSLIRLNAGFAIILFVADATQPAFSVPILHWNERHSLPCARAATAFTLLHHAAATDRTRRTTQSIAGPTSRLLIKAISMGTQATSVGITGPNTKVIPTTKPNRYSAR